MSAAHDFELPPHADVPAEEVDAAAGGQVVYLTRNGQAIAAIVPADVAAAGAAAIAALEDAEDVRAAREVLAKQEPTIPMEDVMAEYADVLAAYPNES